MSSIISALNRFKIKRLIKRYRKVLESHNSLTGLIIDKINIIKIKKLGGMWSSSLTDLATRLPDNSSLSFQPGISSLNDMMDVTSKPLILIDNGGQ